MSRHLKDEMFQCEIMNGQVLIISYIEWLAKQHHYQLPTSQVNPIPYIVNGNDNIPTKDNVALDQY